MLFCGCCLAFVSLALQMHVCPYFEPESNLLKACAEGVLFLTFLISFILRVMPGIETYEPWGHEAYGWVLVGAFSLYLITAVSLTAKQIAGRRRFRAQLLEGLGSFDEDEGGEALAALTRVVGQSNQSQEGNNVVVDSRFTVGGRDDE